MISRLVVFLLGGLSLLAFIYIYNSSSVTTISYFPIDEETSFQYAKTELKVIPKNYTTSNLVWDSESKSVKPLYLRQDVSLLYDNGNLRGVRSKWSENSDGINLKERIPINENSLFQAISYHHGEIHYSRDIIKSIQFMSEDQLYVTNHPHAPKQNDNQYNRFKKKIDDKVKKQLLFHWNELINQFNINTDDYLRVPLTELYKYNNETILSLSKDQTDKVIGQLWEGMYKNYIIPIANPTSDKANNSNYIPLVMFDKKNTHLLVLFEMNGKKQKLIQQYAN